MPRPPLRPRLVLATAAAASLALAGLALSSPASASPWSGTLTKGTSYNATGGGCAVASPGTSIPPVAIPSNTPASLNVGDSTTGTGPTAPDTSALSGSMTGTAQINETATGATDFDITATVSASASRALGNASACSVSANAVAALSGTITVASPTLLDLDLTNIGTGSAQYQLTLLRTSPPVSGSVQVSVSEFGRAHRVVTVQPGDYTLQVMVAAVAASSSSPAYASSTNAKISLHGVFRPFGVADGAQRGLGSKYLTLGDGVTCAAYSVTGDFTAKAGKKAKKGKKPVIKKATFFVNGAKVKSVKKPNKNTLVTLTGVPDDVVTVSAELKLAGKGTVTVERTYLPCS